MSFKSWIDLLEKFTPRCPQCNRKFRNRLTCQVCRTDTCSQNCHSKHFKAAHPELAEQIKAEKSRGGPPAAGGPRPRRRHSRRRPVGCA